MITSRNIDDLVLPVRLRCMEHISACRRAGIELLITCTWRDAEAQDALYAIGRTRPGKIVTHARGGESYHQYGVAYDVVPLRGGKPIWSTYGPDLRLWRDVGEIGESCGLEWAGRWKRFREYPHFQFTAGLSLAEFRAGKTLPPEA